MVCFKFHIVSFVFFPDVYINRGKQKGVKYIRSYMDDSKHGYFEIFKLKKLNYSSPIEITLLDI